MSGAEALAAVGLASNVLQFVEFTTLLCERIHDYSSATSGLPKELAQQASQLNTLLTIFRDLAQRPDGQRFADDIIKQCHAQAQELSDVFENLRVGAAKGRWGTAKTAFKSLKRTQQIEKLQSKLDRLVEILGLQLQVEAKHTAEKTGADVSDVLKLQSRQLEALQSLQISNDTHNPPSDPPQESEPVWIVPLSRNTGFLGREDIFEQLESQLERSDSSRTAVLYGLGGIGKTQIVLEFIFRTRNPSTAVFWVYAGARSRFVESYRRIARECRIPGHENPQADTLQLVRDWLDSGIDSQWLMVVDNVDDRTILFDQGDENETDKALIEYIPQTEKGCLIYTTRSRDVAIDLATGNEPIKVTPLSFSESIALLGTRVIRGSSQEEQEDLLDELAHLPLALSQAAAFMTKRRKTVAEYIKLLRNQSTKSRVLDHRTLHHGREDRSSESVMSTWWITFQHLRKESPRSAELLAMISLLDRQRIPLALFQGSFTDTFNFEEAIGVLEAFSLITTYLPTEPYDRASMNLLFNWKVESNEPVLELCDLHRLVQSSTLEWLSQPDNDGAGTAAKTLDVVAHGFPSGFYETWPLCRLLYPHAKAILRWKFADLDKAWYEDNTAFKIATDRSSLLHAMSTYSRQLGSLRESEQQALQGLSQRQSMMLPVNEQILESMESVALTTALLGRREEALELQRKVLEGRDSLLGPMHRKTLEALNQLGHSLRSVGLYAEAEVQHRRELSSKRILLDEDPQDVDLIDDLTIALDNVANCLRDQGEYEEALGLLEEAIRRGEAAHGQHHPLTWLSMESLAIVEGMVGNTEKAHVLFTQIITWRRELYGDQHHSTLITRGQYMSLFQQEGRYPEAEQVANSLLEDELVAYGTENHSTLHNLGVILQQQKKYTEATIVFKRLLALQLERQDVEVTTVLGPMASKTRYFIKVCLEAEDKMDEAKDYASISSGSSENNHDLEEAEDLFRRHEDAFKQGHFADAEALARQELQVRIDYNGDKDNEAVQTCYLHIARALHEQDPSQDTQTITRQVLAYRKREFGWRSIKTQDALRFLAATVRDQGKLEEAEGHYRQLVLWVDNTFGRLNVKGYEARWGLANVVSRLERYPEAEELYRLNLQAQLDNPRERNPPDLAQAYFNLSCVLRYQNKLEEAEACLRDACDGRVELFGRSDPRTIKAHCCLGVLLNDQARYDEADSLYLSVGIASALPPSGPTEEEDLLMDGEEDRP
ncbi:MAG: hypothetical protein Q9174_003506 [Haloplaca sp. 1 TL-2023]